MADTFAAAGASKVGFSLIQIVLCQGKGRANPDTFLAAGTLIFVNPDLKSIDLISQWLHGPKWTQKAALGAFFRQYRQHDHQAEE